MVRCPVSWVIMVRSTARACPTRKEGLVGYGSSERLGGEGTKTGSCEGQRPASMMTKEGLAVSVMHPEPDGVAHRRSGIGSPLRPSSH